MMFNLFREPHQRFCLFGSVAPVPDALVGFELEEDARFGGVGDGEGAVVVRDLVPEKKPVTHVTPLSLSISIPISFPPKIVLPRLKKPPDDFGINDVGIVGLVPKAGRNHTALQ